MNNSGKAEEEHSDKQEEHSSSSVPTETACHIRNLILNANLTITTAQPQKQHKSQSPTEENKQEKESSRKRTALSGENHMTPTKRRKLSLNNFETPISLNPLASLPVSLISNGTLSVTSESACVAIENGIPILKEASNTEVTEKLSLADKQSSVSVTPVAPVILSKTEARPNQVVEKSQQRNTSHENVNYLKDISGTELRECKKPISIAQSKDDFGINNLLSKALTDVAKVTPFGKIGLIPNPNQMDFLTLLGLEIAVDSCCCGDATKQAESFYNQVPLSCGQCKTDFTKTWHFYKSPLQVLCEYCYAYNEHQILRASQTVRLAKEYTKAINLKQKNNGTQSHTAKTVYSLSTRLPTQHEQAQLFEDYINAAGIFTKGSDGVSDLARLGASIASNPEIYEAAKAVNALDSTSTPLVRARAVQNFQIALFKGLHEKLSPLNEVRSQDQTLLGYQMTIAQMMKQANVGSPQTENQYVETPLASIISAIKEQHHSLVNTIMKQIPKTVEIGSNLMKVGEESLQ